MADTGVVPRLEEMIDLDHAFYVDYSRVRRHQKRVTKITRYLAEIMGLSEREAEILEIASRLHDYGKRIWTPEMIFKKKEKLDEYGMHLIKTHSVASANLIKNDLEVYDRYVAYVFNKYYSEVFKIIECHHENWDGSGYPFGLAGEEIPKLSRIIRVADAYDAMRSPRIYRSIDYQLMTHKETVKKIEDKSGIEFDPMAVAAFMKIPKEMLEKIHEDVTQIPKERLREIYGKEISSQVAGNN
jgi:HD-GYP domain-containing protein (c-di-GMP phosphodiesterase class II)